MAEKRPPNLTVTLPSGVVVDYWDEIGVDGLPQQRRYCYDGQKLVSVSTVANVYDKPALPSWAAKVTVEGLLRLAGDTSLEGVTVEEAKAALHRHGLDHNAVRDVAAKRGTLAHDALLHLLRDGVIPNLSDYPEEWRGYIQAGAKFMVRYRPEAIDCETVVVSTVHGFAGRYDLFARFPTLGGRTGRVDFKTVTEWKYGQPRKDGSKDLLPPYPEHVSQTEGYEIAAVESGYEPSDFRAIVRLGPDGEFDFTESWAGPEHFLGDLASYRNRQALNAAGAAKRKADKAAMRAAA